jgi:uncharacterized protein (TIGR03083 family)
MEGPEMSVEATREIDVDAIEPIAGDEIWRLARTEYMRMLALLRGLEVDDWSRPTDCSAWTVRDMAGHLLGAAEGFSNPLEMLHQYRKGTRLVREGRTDGGMPVDGANAVQVADRAGVPIPELIARYEAVIEPVLRWRSRLRHLPGRMNDVARPFTFRELFEVILTRDTWMHRLDISRATGADFEMTAEHDGRLVADAVRDWAGGHGHPFRLLLTGSLGASYRRGEITEALRIDALEFARLLSGRSGGAGVLDTRIVF